MRVHASLPEKCPSFSGNTLDSRGTCRLRGVYSLQRTRLWPVGDSLLSGDRTVYPELPDVLWIRFQITIVEKSDSFLNCSVGI